MAAYNYPIILPPGVEVSSIVITINVADDIRLVATPATLDLLVGKSGNIALTAFDDGRGGIQIPVPPLTVSSDNPAVATATLATPETISVTAHSKGAAAIKAEG